MGWIGLRKFKNRGQVSVPPRVGSTRKYDSPQTSMTSPTDKVVSNIYSRVYRGFKRLRGADLEGFLQISLVGVGGDGMYSSLIWVSYI
jgi:hypothetical protein